MGAKPSVEIQHLRTSDDDGLERPIETQRLFVAEIGPVCGTLQGEDARRRDRLLPWEKAIVKIELLCGLFGEAHGFTFQTVWMCQLVLLRDLNGLNPATL